MYVLGMCLGTKNYLTCLKFSKNRPGECLAVKEGCFGCGQSGHMLRDYHSRNCKEGSNGTS